jgi:hypothetical protein
MGNAIIIVEIIRSYTLITAVNFITQTVGNCKYAGALMQSILNCTGNTNFIDV